MTDDCVRPVLPQSLGLAHFIWITPLQCILCMGLIWELIDVNGFCALAALTLLGIIQAWLSQKMGPHRCVCVGGGFPLVILQRGDVSKMLF